MRSVLNWQIYSVFHVSNLKWFNQTREFKRGEIPHSPIVVKIEEEYKVRSILKHKGERCLVPILVNVKETSGSSSHFCIISLPNLVM